MDRRRGANGGGKPREGMHILEADRRGVGNYRQASQRQRQADRERERSYWQKEREWVGLLRERETERRCVV